MSLFQIPASITTINLKAFLILIQACPTFPGPCSIRAYAQDQLALASFPEFNYPIFS